MRFGEFVIRQVERREPVGLEVAGSLAGLLPVGDLQADKDMGHAGIGDPVVELGHVARADQFAKPPEAAAFFRDRDCEHRFALLADLGALRDKSQPVEVHVGAAGERDKGQAGRRVPVVGQRLALQPGLGAGHRQRTGRLEDRAGVLKDVLDGGADLIGVDQDDVVQAGLT